MKQSKFLLAQKYTFNSINPHDDCALSARANRQLSQNLALSRVKSALLAVVLGLSRGYFAHLREKDCFECLSPHETAA